MEKDPVNIKYDKLKIYSNLLDSKSGIHSFFPDRLFPIDKLSEREEFFLLSTIAIEYSFVNEVNGKLAIDNLNGFVNNFISLAKLQSFLFFTESNKMIKSKIRSYKGIVPKTIDSSDSLQEEVDIDSSHTIIGAIVKFNNTNFSKLEEMFYTSYRCFLILSDRSVVFSKEFIKEVINNDMIHKGSSSCINYKNLISTFCTKNDIISRISGDGNTIFNFQIFCSTKMKESVLAIMK